MYDGRLEAGSFKEKLCGQEIADVQKITYVSWIHGGLFTRAKELVVLGDVRRGFTMTSGPR